MDRELAGKPAPTEPGHEGSGRAARLSRFAATNSRITVYLESWHNTHDFGCCLQKTAADQDYVLNVENFLRDNAYEESDRGNGQTYVYSPYDDRRAVHGFYHLCASKVHSSEISSEQAAGMETGPVSVHAITWLGRHADSIPNLGKALIVDAALRVAAFRGLRGIVLTAATSNLIPYYEKNQFKLCHSATVKLQKTFGSTQIGTNYLMYADLLTILNP